jgi:hypothetical protein
MIKMNHPNESKMHPVVYALKNMVIKLTQHPAIYPIKHYKKTGRLKRNRKMIAGY